MKRRDKQCSGMGRMALRSHEELSEFSDEQNDVEGKLDNNLSLPVGVGRQGEGGVRLNDQLKYGSSGKPLITVITIVFNGVDILEDTILSIVNQSYGNIEFIVIDGKSQDGTLDIIRKYENAIDYWVSEKDLGIYNAMNKGIVLSRGQWMIFMNAGDQFYDANVLQNVSGILDEEHVDIVFGKSISHFQELSVLRYENFSSDQKDFYKKKLPNHQAVFLSRKKYSDLRYDESYRYCADSDYLFKAFSDGVSREYHGIVSLFELGGASNYYPTFKAFRTIAIESMRLRGGLRPLFVHTAKYLLQRIMGKDRYLRFYVKKGVKR